MGDMMSWGLGGSLFGGGDDAPGADPGIKQSADRAAALGEDWLSFSKDQFANGEERMKAMDALIAQVKAGHLDSHSLANGWAKADRARYENVFLPLQDRLIQDAENWDSPERQAQLAAEARAGVLQDSRLANQANQRQMASMGVNPNSGRFQASQQADATHTALAAANAENQIRNRVREQGMQLRAGAAQLGMGLPGQALANAGFGVNAGNAALGAQQLSNQGHLQNLGIMGQGYQGAINAHGQKAGILGNLHNSNLQAWGAQQQADATNTAGMMQGLGSMAGMAMMMGSSKKIKEHKRPAKGNLAALGKMPVGKWKYKPGVADEGEHIGPYAEDFQAATGLGDGQQIAMQDALGLTMGAVQELDRKVDKLTKQRGA